MLSFLRARPARTGACVLFGERAKSSSSTSDAIRVCATVCYVRTVELSSLGRLVGASSCIPRLGLALSPRAGHRGTCFARRWFII
jgi:hypothetical protein